MVVGGVLVDLHTRTMRRCDVKPAHLKQPMGENWWTLDMCTNPTTLACDVSDTSVHTSGNMWRRFVDSERVGVSIFVLRFGMWRHAMDIEWSPSDAMDVPTLSNVEG